MLVDGAQAAPKLPVNVAELGGGLLRGHAHKLYGPTGVGTLWARLDLLREMPPFLGGGSMIRKVTTSGTTYADPPARFEAGTPAIAPAIGMAAAVRWLDGIGMESVLAHEREITAYAIERLADVPGLKVFGPPRGPERVGPVSFELEGIHAHDVSEILDRHGVAVRAGHHCAQPLMDRLGVAATARASFGVYTTPDEVDQLVDACTTRAGFSSSTEGPEAASAGSSLSVDDLKLGLRSRAGDARDYVDRLLHLGEIDAGLRGSTMTSQLPLLSVVVSPSVLCRPFRFSFFSFATRSATQ